MSLGRFRNKMACRRRAIATGLLVASVAVAGSAMPGVAYGSSGAHSDASHTNSASVVDITWANSDFGDPVEGPELQAMLDLFNKTHRAIHVSAANIPFSSFDQTILTQIAGGEGPDVIRWDTPGFYEAARAGLLESLNGVISAAKYHLRPGPDKYAVINGTRYGIVEGESPYALIYNPTYVKSPPKTFAQFLADAKAATKNGVYGLGVRTTLPQAAGMWEDLCNYVFGFGGDWSNGKKLTLDSPRVVAGLNAYKEVVDAGVVPKGATADTYRSMLAAGKLAMEVDTGGVVDDVKKADPDTPLKVAPVPFPTGKVGEILSLDSVNAASRHARQAETFLEWLLSPTAQRMLVGASGTGTEVATNVSLTPAEKAAKPLAPAFEQGGGNAQPQIIPGFEGYTNQISLIVVQNVLKSLSGESMTTAMQNAQRQAQALLVSSVS